MVGFRVSNFPERYIHSVGVNLDEYSPELTEMVKMSGLLMNFPIFSEGFMKILEAGMRAFNDTPRRGGLGGSFQHLRGE